MRTTINFSLTGIIVVVLVILAIIFVPKLRADSDYSDKFIAVYNTDGEQNLTYSGYLKVDMDNKNNIMTVTESDGTTHTVYYLGRMVTIDENENRE